jgi:hypothetical protein
MTLWLSRVIDRLIKEGSSCCDSAIIKRLHLLCSLSHERIIFMYRSDSAAFFDGCQSSLASKAL